MAKGMADRHPLLCVCSVFIGLVLRDGVQIRLYIFGFLGPLGLDSGPFTTPFLKCVSSNFSKKTNNPNPSPTGNGFGLYWFGAGGGTRTHTVSLPTDFESVTSTIPSHRREVYYSGKLIRIQVKFQNLPQKSEKHPPKSQIPLVISGNLE